MSSNSTANAFVQELLRLFEESKNGTRKLDFVDPKTSPESRTLNIGDKYFHLKELGEQFCWERVQTPKGFEYHPRQTTVDSLVCSGIHASIEYTGGYFVCFSIKDPIFKQLNIKLFIGPKHLN